MSGIEGVLDAAAKGLDSLAEAKLHGSLRDGFLLWTGIAAISGSTYVEQPQKWMIVTLGGIASLWGLGFLLARSGRSYFGRYER